MQLSVRIVGLFVTKVPILGLIPDVSLKHLSQLLWLFHSLVIFSYKSYFSLAKNIRTFHLFGESDPIKMKTALVIYKNFVLVILYNWLLNMFIYLGSDRKDFRQTGVFFLIETSHANVNYWRKKIAEWGRGLGRW